MVGEIGFKSLRATNLKTKNMKLQNLVNHVVFVLDESYSMHPHKQDVVSVFDSQIQYLSRRSQELNQETRVSVYKFNDQIECIIYDMDVMRLPSLKNLYSPSGGTALLDATNQAISELQLTPTIHGDHAFLVFCMTDGEENRSFKTSSSALKTKINSLNDSWSVAILVPDQTGASYAKSCGFSPENIQIWEIGSSKAIEKVGKTVQDATENFFRARASGKKIGGSLFKVGDIKSSDVKDNLDVLNAKDYMVINIRKDRTVIKDAAESWTQKPYVVGSAYYQLTKKETVQANKNILVKHKKNGKVYEGNAARQIVGLPNYEVKCEPSPMHEFEIFIQSTSSNRLLYSGTELIVLL